VFGRPLRVVSSGMTRGFQRSSRRAPDGISSSQLRVDTRVQAVIDRIQRDVGRPVVWREFGEAVGLSPSGLRSLFRQSTGLAPIAYLNHLRFEQARELLSKPASSVLRVKEVMAAVGINDLSHFVRDFKKRYGVTPRVYQRRALDYSRAGESANRLAKSPTDPAL
jgi:AraC-like DNA-binding protein